MGLDCGAVPLPIPGRLALASRIVAKQPERSRHLGPDATAYRPVAGSHARVSPLSTAATWRHHLRQESDAGKPLVRIWAGGYVQSWFQLRQCGDNAVCKIATSCSSLTLEFRDDGYP